MNSHLKIFSSFLMMILLLLSATGCNRSGGNDDGGGLSVFLDGLPPAAPVGFSGDVDEANDVFNFVWDANTESDLGGYVLSYRLASENQILGSVRLAKSATSYSLYSLGDGQMYQFLLQAFDIEDMPPSIPADTKPELFHLDENPPVPTNDTDLNFNVESVTENGQIVLTWDRLNIPDFAGVMVRRKVESPPTNESDGVQVYVGNDVTYTESVVSGDISEDVIYVYRIFPFDEVPNYYRGGPTTQKTGQISSN